MIFGGVGAGLYGILLYAIVAVFIAGLMVGRTPEYIGKKIEQKEVKMAMLAVIATAVQHPGLLRYQRRSSACSPQEPRNCYWNPPGPATANLNNGGPHGFAEILYAYTSAPATTAAPSQESTPTRPGTTCTLGLAMLIGRFLFLCRC